MGLVCGSYVLAGYRRLLPMGTERTTGLPTDINVGDIKGTISTALAERSAPPPYEELCCLHEAVLRHIKALLPLATKQIDGLWRGSTEWYQKVTTLDAIRYEVGEGLGSGLLTATRHVQTLGYRLRFLLENSGLLTDREEPDAVKSGSPADS